jgi:hypothetical protein
VVRARGLRQTSRAFRQSTPLFMTLERQRRLKRLRPAGPPPPGLLRSYYDFLSLSWGVKGPGQFTRRAALAAVRFVNRRLSVAKSAACARLA